MNDTVKGDDNYPKTITATLRFLQYHNLRGKLIHSSDRSTKHLKSELAFAQEGEDDEEKRSKFIRLARFVDSRMMGRAHIKRSTPGRSVLVKMGNKLWKGGR